MYIQELLSPRRVALALAVTTKEQLFGQLGALLGTDTDLLTAPQASSALNQRERLGSTGIGAGVAVPHGRIAGLARPVGAFCTLAGPLDYGAIDHKPVTLAFALVVPDHADNEHLKILAELAGLFSDKLWREQLRSAVSTEELYNYLIQSRPAARPNDPHTHRSRPV
jgi:nitrogen PTS system EIIA component